MICLLQYPSVVVVVVVVAERCALLASVLQAARLGFSTNLCASVCSAETSFGGERTYAYSSGALRALGRRAVPRSPGQKKEHQGAGAAVGGVAGAGKAVTKGVTSGSVSGMAAGMKEAGGELAGGVKGAGSGVAGGVTNAGSAAKRGSVKE